MAANFSLTAGSCMFLGGVVLLAAATLLSIVTAATARGGKRKIEERMKEIY